MDLSKLGFKFLDTIDVPREDTLIFHQSDNYE